MINKPKSTTTSTTRRRIIALLKLTALLVILWFWYVYVRKYWGELRSVEWSLPWTTGVAALLTTVLGYFLRGMLWAPLRYEVTASRLGVFRAFRISALAWMGRYLPGKFWALAGKAYMSAPDKSQLAINAVAASVDTLLFQVSGVLLSLVIFAGYAGGDLLMPGFRLIALLVVGLGLVGCHPRVFCPAANALLRALRQAPLPRRPRYSRLCLFMLGDVATFALWAAGFTILVHSVADVGWSKYPLLAAIFATAWVSGFIALVAPAGIGVRDSILAIGLHKLVAIDPSETIVLVVLSRVVTTVAELLCFLVALTRPRQNTTGQCSE